MTHDGLFHKEIVKIVQSFKVISHSAYIYRDKEYDWIRQPNLNSNDQKYQMISHLQEILYKDIHCRIPLHKVDRIPYYSANATMVRDFATLLSRNNSGHGTYQMGWKVKELQRDGHIIVYKDGLLFRLRQNKFLSKGNKIIVGTKGSVKISKEFFNLSPGFYTAIGDEPLKRNKDSLIVRVYWNIICGRAPHLMSILTTQLNKERIPFTLKVLNSPQNYPRSDAAVLYLEKEHFNTSKRLLSTIYNTIRTSLFPQTSFFSKRIAKGLALAEDPKGKESFGQHRSRILAEAMYGLNDELSLGTKLRQINAYFQKSNLDLRYPYLNVGSADDYDLKDCFCL